MSHFPLMNALALAAFQANPPAGPIYSVTSDFGKGQAAYFRTSNQRGDIQIGRLINFDNKRSIDMASMFSRDGTPGWVSAKDTLTGHLRRSSLYFSSAGIKISLTENGKTKNWILPYPDHPNFKNSPAVWFANVRPALGAVARFNCFDPFTARFYPETIRYVGDKRIAYRGRSVLAHVLVGTREKDWVDDKGVVYRAELKSGRIVLVRN